MARREFSKEVKREALTRSGLRCEADGPLYGLSEGQRCCIPLSAGVEFDHRISDALGGEPTLENCVAACPTCHAFKTATNDTPKAAKVKRQSDKDKGIKASPSRPLPGSRASGLRRRMNGTVERW